MAAKISRATPQLAPRALIFLAIASASCAVPVTKCLGGDDMNRVSNVIEGAEVTVEIATECKLGQRASLSLTVRNNGEARIVAGDYGSMPECRLILLDRDSNRPCELTTEGRQILVESAGKIGQYADLPLPKGAEKTWKLDLRRYYVLHEGNFAFSAEITLRRGEPLRRFTVKVDDLHFSVKK